MLGSCVWKPGERQAIPTSCIPSDALAVNGAEGLEFIPEELFGVLEVRSSFRGRCREAGTSGDEGGSFFTMILGGWPDLTLIMASVGGAWIGVARPKKKKWNTMHQEVTTYEFGERRLPSGECRCGAAPSLITTGALGVAVGDLRSEFGGDECGALDGAKVGYADLGLISCCE